VPGGATQRQGFEAAVQERGLKARLESINYSGRMMMKTMKVLVAGSALGAAILAGPAAAAVTGTVAVTSEYAFRGVTSSDGAAVQGSLDWTDGGLYAGVWGSNTAPLAADGTEVDLYGGYKFKVSEGVELDLGAIYYLFPESEQFDFSPATNSGVANFDIDYPEVYAGINMGGFSGKLYYASDFFNVEGNGASDGESIYLNLAYTAAIKEGLSVKVALGKQSGDGAKAFFLGEEPLDYNISLTKTLENGFAASFAVVGTDLDVDFGGGNTFNDDPKFLVTLSKGFEI
jgi:uncharacterized protein (TIGR02001 family)